MLLTIFSHWKKNFKINAKHIFIILTVPFLSQNAKTATKIENFTATRIGKKIQNSLS